MAKELQDFLTHGHKLGQSDWSAWFTAFRYAESIRSPLLPLIDLGCNFAEKYLRAAERLYADASGVTQGARP